MNKRKRVDWEKEMQKTEEIRMKGFRISILGFAVASLFLFGASRINSGASLLSPMIMIGCFLFATVVLVFTLKRRAGMSKKTKDEGNSESE
jgi:hypothetical protein